MSLTNLVKKALTDRTRLKNVSTALIHAIRTSQTYRKILENVPNSLKPAIQELQYDLATLMQYGQLDMFSSVAIETTSICKRRCTYCPNADEQLRNQRPQKAMDRDIFEKIINDLASINYRGRIALQHYGEPLEDPNIFERVNLVRKKLPNSLITIYSNGDKLTPEKFKQLIKSGLDQILITNHNPSGKDSTNLQIIKDYLTQNSEYNKHCLIRTGIKTLSNRGGLVDSPTKTVRKIKYCIADSHTLVIDVSGNVVICANDYLGQVCFGNTEEKHLMDIWTSKQYTKTRYNNKLGRFKESVCKNCTS